MCGIKDGLTDKCKRITAVGLTACVVCIISTIVTIAIVKSSFLNLSSMWTPIIIVGSCLLGFNCLLLIIGGIGICKDSKVVTFIFAFFVISISLISFGLGIFCLVNSSTKAVTENFGCSTSIVDLKSIYNDIDLYLNQVDQALCSESCPCSLYSPNNTTFLMKNQYVVQEKGQATSFQTCSNATKSNVDDEYMNKSNLKTLNRELLSLWYALMESNFNCVGFCITEGSEKQYIPKYLFTDINRGDPMYQGCLSSISDWAPYQLVILGLLCFVVFLLSLVISILSCCFIFKRAE